MDALANIGNLVRATEFIGQSSGLKFCIKFVWPCRMISYKILFLWVLFGSSSGGVSGIILCSY